MSLRRIAGFVFVAIAVGVFVFQIGLALGGPWGSYAMGGAYPGQFPPSLRVAALIQGLLWVILAGVIVSRAGIALPGWSRVSRWLVWIVVGLAAMSLVLNLMTPSAAERLIWAPVALLMLICSLVVANGPAPPAR